MNPAAGIVASIHTASEAGGPSQAISAAVLQAGSGIVGDRYHAGAGTFSDPLKTSGDWEVTLIESEEIERFNQLEGVALSPGAFRRNVVTRGIRLNELVGRRFVVGTAVLEGLRLCEPCAYLATLLGPAVVKGMVHRAGLRARIVTGSVIRPGDTITRSHDGRPATRALSIGLIGDYDAAIVAHRAIPLALLGAAQLLQREIVTEWVPTASVGDATRVESFDGLWCVPGSPYRSLEGALRAIRHARERNVPYLGTCGGFQHALIEYARNVLGWSDAEHAETAPTARRAVIAPLACSLVEVNARVRLVAGSRIAAAYGAEESSEGYHCRYGLNNSFREQLANGPLRATAMDDAGEVRAVELQGHPFFVATLFQPERAALDGRPVPLALDFLRACAA
jgi:hypothetical protein